MVQVLDYGSVRSTMVAGPDVVGSRQAAAGTAGFLTLLCEFTCRGDPNQAVAVPSVGLGVLIGALVWSQGPGTEWVRAPLPDTESSFGRRGR